MATIPIKRGYSFKVWTTSEAAARNYATLSLLREGAKTYLDTIGANAPARPYPVFFYDGDLLVEGFANEGRPSREKTSGLGSEMVIVYYDDTYGDDLDYNDLIVYVQITKRFNLDRVTDASLMIKDDPLTKVPRLALIGLSCQASLASHLKKLDAGEPVKLDDYSDLPLVRDQLNGEEKKLFDEDPILGARVILHAVSAQNSASSLYEKAELHNGNGDAFRHFYWNFRMSNDTSVGPTWAERWGNAHEDGTNNNPVLERSMDLYNNGVGRRLGQTNVDDDPASLRASVRNGSCRIIRNGQLVKSDSTGESPTHESH